MFCNIISNSFSSRLGSDLFFIEVLLNNFHLIIFYQCAGEENHYKPKILHAIIHFLQVIFSHTNKHI
ncbi:hypothetical protein ACJX0J_031461 [Zea mays]